MDDDDVYWGTRLACVEMIRTGTTRFWDMYWHAHATARAVEDAGSAGGHRGAADRRLRSRRSPSAPARDADRSLEQISEAGGELARPGFAPHAIYSLSERSLRWVAERAAELEVPVQIHLSETEDEVDGCLAAARRAPGLLPRPGRPARAPDRARPRLLARPRRARADRRARRDRRHQPGREPEARRRRGLPLPRRARARASRVGPRHRRRRAPTTRSTCSPTRSSFALLQKNEAARPGRGHGRRRRSRSRPGGARRCSAAAGSRSGRRPTSCSCVPTPPRSSLGELDAGLVYAASGTIVDTTVVAGRVLMRGGVVDGADEVVARARERAERLGIR